MTAKTIGTEKFIESKVLQARDVRRFEVGIVHTGSKGTEMPFRIQANVWRDGRIALGLPGGPDGSSGANLVRPELLTRWPVYAASEADARAAFMKIMGVRDAPEEDWRVDAAGPAPDQIPESVLRHPFFHPDAWDVNSPKATAERQRISETDARAAKKARGSLYDQGSPDMPPVAETSAPAPVPAAPADLYSAPTETAVPAEPETSKPRKRS